MAAIKLSDLPRADGIKTSDAVIGLVAGKTCLIDVDAFAALGTRRPGSIRQFPMAFKGNPLNTVKLTTSPQTFPVGTYPSLDAVLPIKGTGTNAVIEVPAAPNADFRWFIQV